MPAADAITLVQRIAPLGVAALLIGLGSLLREPARQQFSAIFLAGAGAAYLSGGLGLWEFGFCGLITVLAFFGLRRYGAIAAGWLLHSGWDVAHHLWGHPIIPFAPASSVGCAICDPALAIWYALGAPSVWRRGRTT